MNSRRLPPAAGLMALLLVGIMTASAETKPPTNAAQHWAFQPLRPVPVPAVRNRRWPRTDLDRFVLARLEQSNLAPSPAADPRTLIRRMTYDLTGLPPTGDEVEQFHAAVARDGD